MSDLKHQPEDELFRRLKSQLAYEKGLERKVMDLERELSRARQQLGGSRERTKWIIHYIGEKQ